MADKLKHIKVFILAFALMMLAFNQIKTIHSVHGLIFLRGEVFSMQSDAGSMEANTTQDTENPLKNIGFVNQTLAQQIVGPLRVSDVAYAFFFILFVISFGISADSISKLHRESKSP